jgi:hypothetical protein
LFGTREQQAQWLPSLVAGEQLAAFALTEREAGSGRRQCANDRYAERRRLALRFEWRETLHHQCCSVAGLDGDGANAGSEQAGQRRDYRFFGHAGHAGVEMIEGRMPKLGIRGTPRAFPFKQCARAERKYSLARSAKVCASR